MISEDYKYSTIHTSIDEVKLIDNSVYLFGYSQEPRSRCVDHLQRNNPTVTFIELIETSKDKINDKLNNVFISLRNSTEVKEWLKSFKKGNIYIDVTGLNNRICASLLKNSYSLEGTISTKVIYVEPKSYDIKKFSAESDLNDLSEKIEGIEPLPGLASIFQAVNEEESCFIALLGFEGGRFTHIIENTEVDKDNIIPFIGVPGYRIEYPFVAMWGNRIPLEDTQAWRKIQYVNANSPICIFLELQSQKSRHPNRKFKIAPIGTKPHAIGAILFAIKYPSKVEIIYDNPIKKTVRTIGIGNIIECDISKLLNADYAS